MNMKVPFVDLHAQYISIKNDIDTSVRDVIEQTAFIGGKYVQEFEQQFVNLYGVKHCISVANGTDSLYIIMKMLGIGPGDEVITVANSWISSSETISQTGAKPVFVDCDPVFMTIDEELISDKITPNTKAIIPVHLYGQACHMDKIMDIANRHKLYVIEDCAQSHFSQYKGLNLGTIGIAGSFSFYPGKNLGAYGDAGCLITNNDDLAKKCRMYARHGALKKHEHQIEGINSRLDGLQAAILSAKMPYILQWTESRIQNAKYYTSLLADCKNIELPVIRDNSKHTFHLYVIKTHKRNELMKFLKEKDIETAIHYPVAIPNMKAYEYLGYVRNDFPVSSNRESEILSLPMYAELSREQIEYITTSIKTFFENN